MGFRNAFPTMYQYVSSVVEGRQFVSGLRADSRETLLSRPRPFVQTPSDPVRTLRTPVDALRCPCVS